MSNWSLLQVYASVHEEIQSKLGIARKTLAHPTTKGDASEDVWIQLFNDYLPHRYKAAKAHVADSMGSFSDQLDVVIFDRQYSPLVFCFQEQWIIPAESVYAVFEVKQKIDLVMVKCAQQKVASVRRLTQTSLPIPHAGGTHDPKPPIQIIGGILTLESEWTPALGDSFKKALETEDTDERLDIGCIAAHGYFHLGSSLDNLNISYTDKAATGFLFKLISLLQASGTVPMIDIEAYSKWIET